MQGPAIAHCPAVGGATSSCGRLQRAGYPLRSSGCNRPDSPLPFSPLPAGEGPGVRAAVRLPDSVVIAVAFRRGRSNARTRSVQSEPGPRPFFSRTVGYPPRIPWVGHPARLRCRSPLSLWERGIKGVRAVVRLSDSVVIAVAFRRGRIRGGSAASAENPAQPLPQFA